MEDTNEAGAITSVETPAPCDDDSPLLARKDSSRTATVDIDPELEGQVCGPPTPPPYETLRAIGGIIKAFVGSGVLFLPAAFQQGGYAFAIPLMLLMAFLNGFGMIRLLQCRAVVIGSFGYVANRALGRPAQVAVDTSLVLAQAGFACVYASFIAQNGLQILNAGRCFLGGEWVFALLLLQVRSIL